MQAIYGDSVADIKHLSIILFRLLGLLYTLYTQKEVATNHDILMHVFSWKFGNNCLLQSHFSFLGNYFYF